MIQNAFRMSWSLVGLWCCTMVWGQCEADYNVIVTNFEFTPSSLTVVPGETVAFINIEGLHGVNGDSSTVTGASFGNPEVFALDQAEGTIEGTCLGVVTFDIPGVYQYDCPVGYNAEAGMQAEIVVDAFDLADLLFQTS
ncbi:MAG: plastocyanin/azurin family copper-binding protein, partial [Bacteroidota bacterium]|nr:plastocyanin/azurin family copper-binding protein [Bacteroidota bacterium]